MNGHYGGAGIPNIGTHLIQNIRQGNHLRLTGRIAQKGFPFGQNSCHHQVFRTGYGGEVEINITPHQAASRSLHISMFELDVRPQAGQTFEVQVDGSRTNGTTARQRYPRFFEPGEQRPENQYGRPHFPNQVVRCFMAVEAAGIDTNRAVFIDYLDAQGRQ